MYIAGFTSINKWVKEPKDTPRYACLSGFEPGKTPSKGYDHILDKFLLGYGLHFAATPMVDNPSNCLPLTFFV